MSLGSDTQVINGQRTLTPTNLQYNPLSYGVQTTGVPNVSPSMPPYMGGGSAAASTGAAQGVGGYGTAGNNQQTTMIAAANPHNLKVSPVWWAVGALVVGLTLLNFISWRHTAIESFDEKGTVGSAKESASEEA